MFATAFIGWCLCESLTSVRQKKVCGLSKCFCLLAKNLSIIDSNDRLTNNIPPALDACAADCVKSIVELTKFDMT